MKFLANTIFRLMGWKIVGSIPPDIKKCVILAAPHTANSDFFIGRIAYWCLGVPVKFLIKKEAFENPLGWLLRKFGGISVDRAKSNNLVEGVAHLFNEYEVLNVVITPEGTRKLSKEWKKGFYFIALRAKVPIILGFVDYKTKEGGFGPTLYPSGDFDKDFMIIQEFYKTKTACHPELFSLSPENLAKN
ncbi:MAG: lysophospholipid acyltransferase family protein [Ignavibacteria bacterium]|nr:lysophospholipid acyltransferase family protein [Ignavibacteria bacterium]